jgi:ketosteroid isomerase-like protein
MQRIFDAVSRGDPTLFYERLADDAKLIITGEYSWSQTIEGKERIGATCMDMFVHDCRSAEKRSRLIFLPTATGSSSKLAATW